jgi:hypothetical protein
VPKAAGEARTEKKPGTYEEKRFRLASARRRWLQLDLFGQRSEQAQVSRAGLAASPSVSEQGSIDCEPATLSYSSMRPPSLPEFL